MSSDRPKFTLNLNETNSLGFAMRIEGSSSDVDATNPEFRFVLAERSGEKAWLYPMARDEEGDVVVSIPSEDFFSEEKEYHGQVEVILGNHYFIPTTVDIEFIKPLKVEAVAKVKSSSGKELNEVTDGPLRVASVTARTKNNVVKKEATARRSGDRPVSLKPAKPKKKTWDALTESEKEQVKKVLKERKLKQLRAAKRAEIAEAKRREVATKKASAAIKNQLKSLMSNSLSDED